MESTIWPLRHLFMPLEPDEIDASITIGWRSCRILTALRFLISRHELGSLSAKCNQGFDKWCQKGKLSTIIRARGESSSLPSSGGDLVWQIGTGVIFWMQRWSREF